MNFPIGAPTAFNAVAVSTGGRVGVIVTAGARGLYIVTLSAFRIR